MPCLRALRRHPIREPSAASPIRSAWQLSPPPTASLSAAARRGSPRDFGPRRVSRSSRLTKLRVTLSASAISAPIRTLQHPLPPMCPRQRTNQRRVGPRLRQRPRIAAIRCDAMITLRPPRHIKVVGMRTVTNPGDAQHIDAADLPGSAANAIGARMPGTSQAALAQRICECRRASA